MINWPENIISDIARRKCVLVLGAGVSKNSSNSKNERPKDWKEVLLHGAGKTNKKKLITGLVKVGDLLTACEILKKVLGRDKFNEFIRNEYQTPKFPACEIHKYVYDLDSRIVATPNFDKIFDVYADHVSKGNINIKTYYDDDIADCIRRLEPTILKIHGTITTPDKLIFSRKDYSKARTGFRDFYSILEALIITHTFIFIGCGISDPDIRLLLEDNGNKFRFARNHYIVTPKNANKKEVLDIVEETMNLTPILYDSKNNHSILTESLRVLVDRVELKRQEFADKMNW